VPVNLSIKSVPEHVAARLRERAERNHRSLQGELMAIIESAVDAVPAHAKAPASAIPARGAVVGFDPRGRPIVRKGTRRIEDIAAELLGLTPQPRLDLPRSVDIVRAMRDSR
jgi:plasmid stability protein